MIFINATGGRTGNQLVILSHLYASSLEYNIPFFNFGPSPDKDFIIRQSRQQRSHHFPFLVRAIGWMVTHPCMRSCLKTIGIHIPMKARAKAEECVPIIREAAQKHQFILPYMWPYTDYKALYKHQEGCRSFITPKPQYCEEAAAIIAKLRQTGQTLVGVHVRRTDYKTWFRGKYYYDPSVYEKAMRDMIQLCPNGVRFVICSDEKLTAADFPSINAEQLYISRNAFVTDFVLLSSCDYIIGPPSTFSGYASFYGKAKKVTLYSADQRITSTDQFGIVMIDYDDLSEQVTDDGDVHREYVKLSKGSIVSCSVPTLPN